jgi:hypothetical protein
MSDADSELWSQFLEQEGLDGSQFTYDVQLGSKKAEAPADDERGQRLYRALFAKRADALRFTEGATELYEVKPQADLRVLGQLLVYADLIATKLRPDRPVEMHLVTRELDPDIELSLSLRGVEVHVVHQPSAAAEAPQRPA